MQRKLPILFSTLYVSESGFAYHKEFMSYPKNTYMEGFWQSEKYFKDIESTIKSDFTFNENLNAENTKWKDKINAVNSVSIHVRRGDYVSNKNTNTHHGTSDLAYYKRAVDKLAETETGLELFVFSDDLDWCKTNFNFKFPINFVDTNVLINYHLDMHLMSCCQHNIIANSSFSWWGAWLNTNPTKKVIAPQKWFNDNSIDTSDLIPETWMKL